VVADTAVRIGRLENGLTYFIRRNVEPRARAELRLALNAGSILEDDDQRGLAHVIEHMAFNGTRSFEEHEIVDYLESVGMRFGPDINAYTSFDETVYTLTLPTDRESTLETGLEILREWATEITFDSVQVEQERGVVIEEWRLNQGVGSRIQDQQFPVIAHGSRYADRLPIGTAASLSEFQLPELLRFYREWYRPELMAVVVVGDVEVDEIEALIRERFADIPVHSEPRERLEFPVPPHSETILSVATDPELTSSSISLYLKTPPAPWTEVRDYRRWLAEGLAGSMLINRLYEATREPDAPLLDVSSFQGRFVRTLDTFGVSARAPDERVGEGLQALVDEMARAVRFGFTDTELEREKREARRDIQQRYTERERITSGSYAAEYVSWYLYGGSVLGLETEYRLQTGLLDRITLEEVNEATRRWMGSSDRVVLVNTPEQSGVEPPAESELRAILDEEPARALLPYRDQESDAPLLRRLPEPGSVVEIQELPAIEASIWRLSNGARVVLKPTSFREDEVLFAAWSPGGTSQLPDEDFIAGMTASGVVQSGGLGELSANDLRKRLAGTVAGVGADIGDLYEGLSGASSRQDLETLFQLAYLRFMEPRPDSTAFLTYQSQARAALANRQASPENALSDTLRVVLSQGHPRARPLSVGMFDQLDMDRSFEIYRDRFADASDFTFILVGAFDPDELRPLIERYLASLPSINRVEEGRDLGVRPPQGVVEKVVRRGLEPRATTQLVFTGPIVFDRENALALQGLAEVLTLRLRENLRETLGGTYGVDVRGSAAGKPVPRYQFSIGFGSDPERVDELVEAVFAEIDRMKVEGPTPEEMAKVREMQFRSREVSLRQNQFWLAQLYSYDQYGWDLEELATIATRFDSLEPDAIQDAARRILNRQNYVRVSLMPEASPVSGVRP
jgi:zinc protease